MRGALVIAAVLALLMAGCAQTDPPTADATSIPTNTSALDPTPRATEVATPEPTPRATPASTPEASDEYVVPESPEELVAGAISFFEDLGLTCLQPEDDYGSNYCVAGDSCELQLQGEPAAWGCTTEYPPAGGIYADFIAQDGPSLTLELEFVGEGELPDWAREILTATVARVCGLEPSAAEAVVEETFASDESDGCTNRSGGQQGVRATLSGFPPSEETPPHYYIGGYANFVLAD